MELDLACRSMTKDADTLAGGGAGAGAGAGAGGGFRVDCTHNLFWLLGGGGCGMWCVEIALRSSGTKNVVQHQNRSPSNTNTHTYAQSKHLLDSSSINNEVSAHCNYATASTSKQHHIRDRVRVSYLGARKMGARMDGEMCQTMNTGKAHSSRHTYIHVTDRKKSINATNVGKENWSLNTHPG